MTVMKTPYGRTARIFVIVCSWLVSIVMLVVMVALGEFGAPSWVFVLCGFWMLTIGLPTTVVLLLLAWVWGRIPGLETPGLASFAGCVAVLSLIGHTAFLNAANAGLRRVRRARC